MGSKECRNFCIIALSIKVEKNKTVLTVFFNNEAYHSSAISLAVLDNILFMTLSGPNASITVFNKPQPHPYNGPNKVYVWFFFFWNRVLSYFCCLTIHIWKTANTSISYLYLIAYFIFYFIFCRPISGLQIVQCLAFGISVVVGTFSLQTVTERISQAKDIQFLSGVCVLTYWLSALLCDLIFFSIPSCVLLVSISCSCIKSLFPSVVHTNFYSNDCILKWK